MLDGKAGSVWGALDREHAKVALGPQHAKVAHLGWSQCLLERKPAWVVKNVLLHVKNDMNYKCQETQGQQTMYLLS